MSVRSRIFGKELKMNENWKPVSWHCANCGSIVKGYRDSKGVVKVQCSVCGAVMYSKPMGRRHDRIEIYAPYGQERIG